MFFSWTGRKGFQVMIFHCIDEASMFQLGRQLENRPSQTFGFPGLANLEPYAPIQPANSELTNG